MASNSPPEIPESLGIVLKIFSHRRLRRFLNHGNDNTTLSSGLAPRLLLIAPLHANVNGPPSPMSSKQSFSVSPGWTMHHSPVCRW